MKFFTIPVFADGAADELNRFLAGHRVLSIDRHLVQDGTASAWANHARHPSEDHVVSGKERAGAGVLVGAAEAAADAHRRPNFPRSSPVHRGLA